MRDKKFTTINCPVCGAEYLPSEIYIPKYFIGTAKNVQRDENGKIIDFDDELMDTAETYTCDKCHNPFKVKAHITFHTSLDKHSSFFEDYTTKLNSDFELNEESV